MVEYPLSHRITQEPAVNDSKELNQAQHSVLVVAYPSHIFFVAHVKLLDSVKTNCSGR